MKQVQAHEICVAGLEVFMAHLDDSPSDYSALIDPVHEDISFSTVVTIPYKVYGDSSTSKYTTVDWVESKVYITITPDKINQNKLLATATTDYGLTDTAISLEIYYTLSGTSYTFQKGRILI